MAKKLAPGVPTKPKQKTSGKRMSTAATQRRIVARDPIAAQDAPTPLPETALGKSLGSPNLLGSLATSTVRIVQQAASVLEEELATGISTARRLEERLVNVNELRSGKPDEVFHRFRRDAHEVVDILLDVVNLATRSLGGVTQRAVRVGTSEPANQVASATGDLPTLTLPGPVHPGDRVELPLTLENDSDKPTDPFQFICTDLVNVSGARIDAQQVTFHPNGLSIPPQDTALVTIALAVPLDAPSGTYSGLMQATQLQKLRALLTVQVESTSGVTAI
jgi:hypothetical protein